MKPTRNAWVPLATLTMRYRRQQICSALFGWADSQQRTDDDVRALVDSVNATMQKNIASELAFGGGDDELEPADDSKIAYGPSDRLSETFDVAQKGLQPS